MLAKTAVPRVTAAPRFARWVLAAACASFLLAAPVLAQGDCEAGLQAAEKSYQVGTFEDVPGQLEPCLKEGASRAELIRAYSLLARSFLAADQLEKAREAVAELLRVDPTYEPGPPPRFAKLVEEGRRLESVVQVETVSKTLESLREAPATVVVIRAEEIERRGYLDLEEVIHDLPGFNISRSNGETYSTLYQRGFRSKDNDRILLLVDGVEQNDLSTGVAHLSRQYPVSNVDRIEVVYGPAATIYGANAYSGVINVITKAPEALIAPGRRFGLLAQAIGGSRQTRGTELSLAGRDGSGNVAWSITGRLFRADEPDLSRFPGWRYEPEAIPYRDLLQVEDEDAAELCEGFGRDFYCGEDRFGPEPPYEVTYDEDGVARSVRLTEAGERIVRELDGVNRFRFSDRTEDWSFHAKLRLAGLTLGLQAWSLEEGTASAFNGDGYAERVPGSWAPQHRSLYIKYARPLAKGLSLSLFTRYRQTELDPGRSSLRRIMSYADGELDLGDLVDECFGNGLQSLCRPSVEKVETPRRLSNQAATELTLVYAPSRRLTVVSGLDLRKSTVQTKEVDFRSDFEAVNLLVDRTDLGVYTQATFKPLPAFSLVAGGRVDYDEAGSPEFPDTGFGTLFSPRLALVYSPGRWALKLIYAEAFKDPSDFEKFSAEEDERLPNPRLRPERTRALEVEAGWYPAEGTSFELSAYRTRYHDIVARGEVCAIPAGANEVPIPFPCPTPDPPPDALYNEYQQFQNLVEMEVLGLELRAETRLGRMPVFGNLTLTDPRATAPAGEGGRDRMRIADIAGLTANLGARLAFGERAELTLLGRYVGSRRTGEGTTVPTNLLRRVDAYAVADLTFTYRDLPRGATVQLLAKNLFDRSYDDPGVLVADRFNLAASVPQAGRTIYLRVAWGLPAKRP